MFTGRSVKQLMAGVAVVVLAVVVLISAISFTALQDTSAAAIRMAQGKDVVADILPPPLYVIEAQLVGYELLRAPAEHRAALTDKMTALKRDYDDRNRFWEGTLLDDAVKRSLLGEQRNQADRYWNEVERNFLPALAAGDRVAAEKAMQQMHQHYTAHRAGVEASVKTAGAFAEATLGALATASQRARYATAAVGVIGLAIVLAGLLLLSSQIIGRLGGEPVDALKVTQRIAGGDLTQTETRADKGVLNALEQMRGNLQALVRDVSQCAGGLADAAPRLLERADKAKQSAEQQFGNASSIARAAEELAATTNTAAEHAARVGERVSAAGQLARQGVDGVRGSVGRMREVSQTVEQAVQEVQSLGQQSGEISGIVQVIRGIADQTNLLALNAAIEAARAGESGRGFAVVADEVRKLAERTAKSTAEIESMVGSIQEGTSQVIRGIETTAASAARAAAEGEQTASAIGQIEDAVGQVSIAIHEVAASLSEQKQIALSVAQSIDQISIQAEGSLQRAAGNADEARSLVSLSDQLRSAAAHFRV